MQEGLVDSFSVPERFGSLPWSITDKSSRDKSNLIQNMFVIWMTPYHV